jgi:hypothetical protein
MSTATPKPHSKQQHIQRAISQFTDRAPVPEIDFTQHALEDGTTVSTQERMVKDVSPFVLFQLDLLNIGCFLLT